MSSIPCRSSSPPASSILQTGNIPEARSVLVHWPRVQVQQCHRTGQVGEDGQEPLDRDLREGVGEKVWHRQQATGRSRSR